MMSTPTNNNIDGIMSGRITVTGSLTYVIEDSDGAAALNNNWPDNLSEVSTVPENETYVMEEPDCVEDSGINGDTNVEEEDEEDDVDQMEISIRDFMEEKLREEEVEDQEMEDVSPVSKTSKL